MKIGILPSILALLIALSSTINPALAENADLLPVDEGWINGESDGTWSKSKPDTLGVRWAGRPGAWVAYLKFQLPEDMNTLSNRELVLQFANAEDEGGGDGLQNNGTYKLLGVTGGNWSSETLNAKNAPAWNTAAFQFDDEALPLDVRLLKSTETRELSFPLDGKFLSFCRENAGKTITLIIAKETGRSSAFHSNRGNPEAGPRIR